MKKLLGLLVVLTLNVVLIETSIAQVIARPPAQGYGNRGNGWRGGGYPNQVYRGNGWNRGPGAPFYNNNRYFNNRYYNNYPIYSYPLYNNYPLYNLPVYPSLPYQTQFPFYYGSNVNPFYLPQQFNYQQQVFVCSFQGANTGLYYSGWGVTPDTAQQYANYSCSTNEGNCVFTGCIQR